ncbi:hypothetical protein AVEN_230889-1 [Araneus ventricosus]|uniref:Uncharacterized protein n=1 Tax=Araneus ventricosus TaxID=182803 RepID=A0A4Y2A3W8_ARAVE|nr:hypothetical protein AVEN_230889-1 [Araneus ventricosus]
MRRVSLILESTGHPERGYRTWHDSAWKQVGRVARSQSSAVQQGQGPGLWLGIRPGTARFEQFRGCPKLQSVPDSDPDYGPWYGDFSNLLGWTWRSAGHRFLGYVRLNHGDYLFWAASLNIEAEMHVLGTPLASARRHSISAREVCQSPRPRLTESCISSPA